MKNFGKIFTAILFSTACAAFAQTAAIQQLQNSQAQNQLPSPELRVGTNAPELYAGENEDVGPQRILRVNKTRDWSRIFDVTLDSQIFYSDNANFASAHSRIGSAVFVNTAQAALAPDAFNLGPGKFSPAAGFFSQWYNYSSRAMQPLDFDAQTAFVNLRYLVGNWQFSVGGNYTRLVSQPDYNDETYNELLPSFTIQRAFPVGPKAAFILGDTVDYHFTHVPSVFGGRTDLNDHLDNLAWLAFNWQPTAHLVVQPFYRFQFSNYKNDTLATADRNDYLSAAGVNVIYAFSQNFSVRAFFNYTTKTSDDAFTPAYDEWNGGIGATFDFKF
jgi:hypothetical protein